MQRSIADYSVAHSLRHMLSCDEGLEWYLNLGWGWVGGLAPLPLPLPPAPPEHPACPEGAPAAPQTPQTWPPAKTDSKSIILFFWILKYILSNILKLYLFSLMLEAFFMENKNVWTELEADSRLLGWNNKMIIWSDILKKRGMQFGHVLFSLPRPIRRRHRK